jgi:hypothetical protein
MAIVVADRTRFLPADGSEQVLDLQIREDLLFSFVEPP